MGNAVAVVVRSLAGALPLTAQGGRSVGFALLAVTIAAVLFAVRELSWVLRELPAWPVQIAEYSPKATIAGPRSATAMTFLLANCPCSNLTV